jgi:signal transduction histidine kinase/ActR/RegA family two-component response regulator
MKGQALGGVVLAVALAAVAAFVMLPTVDLGGRYGTLLLLAALAALAGTRPVHIPALRTKIVATHPFVFCALAALGPRPAVLAAVAGVAAETLTRKKRIPLHLVFNLASVILTTATAYLVFRGLGGAPGDRLLSLAWPLVGATAVYFVVNTGLVAVVITLDKKQPFLETWKGTFLWTAVSYFTGLTLAACLLLVLENVGPWGRALGMPPTLMLVAFYRTHKERLEEKLRRIEEVETLNIELERTVGELQLEIDEREQAEEALQRSEEQLRQSQKMEAIGRLAGGVAHDFNNLVTAITGYSDLMLRSLDAEDPLRANVDEIKKAGDRAASLTRQLLAFSRKQVLAPVVVDLNAAVANMDNLLRRVIGEDIELVHVPCTDLGHVKADPGQMEQVIVNLAVNARDAMPGGGKLTIETANVEVDREGDPTLPDMSPGSYVRVTVRDTGCGMDDATRSKIFEPFCTTKPEGRGTGLGLSTVFGIVKQSAGWIRVDSEPGRGTSFDIHLPRVEGEAGRARPQRSVSEMVRGTEKILLVEDEEQIRDLAREILEMNGYTVFEAPEPAEALSISEQHRGSIDLLLTDVVMPGMNGPDLYESLSPAHPDMKILFMSGYTDRDAVSEGKLEDGVAFIQKPFTLDALAEKVREVLDTPSLADRG